MKSYIKSFAELSIIPFPHERKFLTKWTPKIIVIA